MLAKTFAQYDGARALPTMLETDMSRFPTRPNSLCARDRSGLVLPISSRTVLIGLYANWRDCIANAARETSVRCNTAMLYASTDNVARAARTSAIMAAPL